LRAIISDIHANLEALQAVLKDIKDKGITSVQCLGDVVGYGPDPVECCDITREAVEWCLLGNHDEAVVDEVVGGIGFNPLARAVIDLHRKLIKPGWLSNRQRKDRWEWLRTLPRLKKDGDFMYVHGSPRDPTMEYVLRSDCEDLMGGIPDKIRECFEKMEASWICFNGHTHDPGVITEDGRFHTPAELNMEYRFEKGKKALINVGSVGQPRDGDPRCCYVTIEDDLLRYVRVEYEHAKTAEKIRAIPGIDPRMGDRLAQGR
jgi:diadenosine tetraphosphatase ApaH/serine/threonine PP2A family protein phosphatase